MCFKKGEENILGTELVSCSLDPLTGFYRDGFCKAFDNDPGEHTVCVKLTNKFLIFSNTMDMLAFNLPLIYVSYYLLII